MTLDYYRIFYYVARYKSFSNAAEMLGSNQPNITRCMNILENELDCKLLIRSHKGIQLTTEGEHLFRHVAIAIEQLTYGEKEIIKNKSLESGQINIGISETAMRLYLLDKLQEFHKDYPHVRLKISNHSTPQAIDALEKGLVDIAMVTSPLEIRKPLRKTALRSYHDILIGGSAYKTTASRKRSLKELADFSFVSLSAGTGTNDLYVRFFCNFLFFFGNHTAVFLRTDSHFDECFLDICLLNICPAFFCCKNGSLIQQILQICSCKSRSRLCDLF